MNGVFIPINRFLSQMIVVVCVFIRVSSVEIFGFINSSFCCFCIKKTQFFQLHLDDRRFWIVTFRSKLKHIELLVSIRLTKVGFAVFCDVSPIPIDIRRLLSYDRICSVLMICRYGDSRRKTDVHSCIACLSRLELEVRMGTINVDEHLMEMGRRFVGV
jgi:hypothetical protein